MMMERMVMFVAADDVQVRTAVCGGVTVVGFLSSGGGGCFGSTSSGKEPPFVSFCIFLFLRFDETDADTVQWFEIGSVTVQMEQTRSNLSQLWST
ncbi:hypothetical protein Hanom_Chr14g01267821 [Helianthus anomalus]